MGNVVQIHIVAQNFIKGFYGKQDVPIGQTRAEARGAAHAVHAFAVVGTLEMVVHACAVFLAKGNLFVVLDLRQHVVCHGDCAIIDKRR